MKSQISGTSAVRFNLKFLIEIMLIIIVGAIIFIIIVAKARPSSFGGSVFNYAKITYTLMGAKG